MPWTEKCGWVMFNSQPPASLRLSASSNKQTPSKRLDINPKTEANHVADILLGDYHVYMPGYLDFVRASSVCTQNSIARTTGPS